MHTDEAINAYIIGELLAGKSFHYDPQDHHGPALTAFTLPLVKLEGAHNFQELTESELRLSTVLAGTATVLLFGAGVELFGFIPCLIAALLFAVAPLPVYYNRYFIHESYFVAATFGLILSGWRAWQNKSRRSKILCAALAGGCAALLLACKETAPLHFFALAVAAFGCWLIKRGTPNSGSASFKTTPRRADQKINAPYVKMLAAFITIFIFTAVLLFTWFGKNWGVFTDLYHAIFNFTARAGGEGHQKSFWYYARLMGDGWSDGIIFSLAVFGIYCGTGILPVPFQKIPRPAKYLAHNFIIIYAITIFAVYSFIPYKTPWLALNFWLPLSLLAGVAIESLWLAFPKCSVRAFIVVFLCALGFLIAHDTRLRVFTAPADEKNPYAYAHTVEDLLGLPVRVEELSRQENLAQPRIAVVAADAWPLPWYLRKFSQTGYWQPGQEPGAADFYITTTDVPDNLTNRLANLRPEFFGVRPEALLILWPSPVKKLP